MAEGCSSLLRSRTSQPMALPLERPCTLITSRRLHRQGRLTGLVSPGCLCLETLSFETHKVHPQVTCDSAWRAPDPPDAPTPSCTSPAQQHVPEPSNVSLPPEAPASAFWLCRASPCAATHCRRSGLTCRWLVPLLTGFAHPSGHDVLQKETIRQGSPAPHRIPAPASPGRLRGGRMGRAACPVSSAHEVRAAWTGEVTGLRDSAV